MLPTLATADLREHKISRCMFQHRFQARPEEACSHQAHKMKLLLLALGLVVRGGCGEGCAVGGVVRHACNGMG
jgi:hypothetical protein